MNSGPAAAGLRALPGRDEIAERYRWRLTDIFADEQAWEEAFARVEALLHQADAFRGQVTASAEQLLGCLRWLEAIGQEIARVYTYAMLRHDEDTTHAGHQALFDRAQRLQVRVAEATAFVRPEILAAPAAQIRGYLEQHPQLRLYEHYLDDILRQKDHVLSVELEAVLAQAGEVAEVPHKVFTMLNDADLRFPVITDEDGSPIELTKARYPMLLQRRSRRVRREAFEALTQTYHGVRHTLAAALDGAVKVNLFHARVRRYPSALAAALHDEGIDPAVYDNLIRTTRAHLAPLHRYHALRRRWLGLDALEAYDLHVPLTPEVPFEVSYEEACGMVEEALAPLGPEYVAVLRRAFNERWIDVHENRGKRAGAYSTGGAYGVHPYVLLNWQNDLDSLFTLAHELGHALHSYFSQRHQPYIYAGYKIFVAEVASTVNEGLLVHHLLRVLPDGDRRRRVLNHYLDDFRGTLYTQVLFAEFEQRIHERAAAGEPLTADALSELYRQLCAEYWGPDVHVDERVGVLWSRIPHFYYGFYVYKYATGFSAATALVDRILAEGDAAVARYLEFLKSGGSDYPLNLLERAGVDLRSPEPIARALRRFDQLIDEFERDVTGSA
ncbi:MAG TPA: oligoendopeptidase F [Bacillota bacterium]